MVASTKAATHGQLVILDIDPFVIRTWVSVGGGAAEIPQVNCLSINIKIFEMNISLHGKYLRIIEMAIIILQIPFVLQILQSFGHNFCVFGNVQSGFISLWQNIAFVSSHTLILS